MDHSQNCIFKRKDKHRKHKKCSIFAYRNSPSNKGPDKDDFAFDLLKDSENTFACLKRLVSLSQGNSKTADFEKIEVETVPEPETAPKTRKLINEEHLGEESVDSEKEDVCNSSDDESSSDESLTDDDPVAISFTNNKSNVKNDILHAHQNLSAGTLVLKGMAAALTSKTLFLSLAIKELNLLRRRYGEMQLNSYIRHMQKMLEYYKEQYGRLFDYGGYETEYFQEKFMLSTTNIFNFVLLPELLTRYEMERNICSYKDALKFMYGKEDVNTSVFHRDLLLKVGKCITNR